jgi:hypothetical protein
MSAAQKRLELDRAGGAQKAAFCQSRGAPSPHAFAPQTSQARGLDGKRPPQRVSSARAGRGARARAAGNGSKTSAFPYFIS